MTYSDALAWLYDTQWHGIKLGLEPMRRLLAELAVPLQQLRCVHVAGTNGKGSVCAMVESVARAGGYRTGLYTSPHLVDFRERIRVNGEMISEEAVAAGLTALRELTATWEHTPTFFELTSALALQHFAASGVEVAVLETGLGGRLDATNVVTPAVSVITPVAMDHQQYLGDTLEAIAGEKAGIIKPGVPVVLAPQASAAEAVLRQVAAERGSRVVQVQAPWDEPVGLAGEHQRWNAAVAVVATVAAGLQVGEAAVAVGLRQVQWPGRFHMLRESRVVVDGAHNPAAARVLAETWRAKYGTQRCTLILGMAADKEVAAICGELAHLPERLFTVPIRNPRTLAPADLAAVWRIQAPETEWREFTSFAEALAQAECHPEPILIAGSLFLVGEALAHLQGAATPTQSAQ